MVDVHTSFSASFSNFSSAILVVSFFAVSMSCVANKHGFEYDQVDGHLRVPNMLPEFSDNVFGLANILPLFSEVALNLAKGLAEVSDADLVNTLGEFTETLEKDTADIP